MGPDGESGHCFQYQHVKLRLKGGRPSGQWRILICMVAENPYLVFPLRVTLTRCVTGNPLSIDSDGCGNREIGVGSLGHFGSADYTVRAKQAVTISRMKAPRIGAGNMSLPKDILCEVQLTPPRIASTRIQTIAPMTIDPIARIAMERIRFLRFRMF